MSKLAAFSQQSAIEREIAACHENIDDCLVRFNVRVHLSGSQVIPKDGP
jgi:hypothetical protein